MMNVASFKKIVLISIFTALPLFAQAAGSDGTGGGSPGGGDVRELEFKNVAQSVYQAMKNRTVPFDLEAYENAINSTSVRMVRNKLYKGTIERDALNYPTEHKIEINRESWVLLEPELKVQLVYHEYLAVAGLEGDDASLSKNIVSLLGSQLLEGICEKYFTDGMKIKSLKWVMGLQLTESLVSVDAYDSTIQNAQSELVCRTIRNDACKAINKGIVATEALTAVGIASIKISEQHPFEALQMAIGGDITVLEIPVLNQRFQRDETRICKQPVMKTACQNKK